jgi:hypothetical protein
MLLNYRRKEKRKEVKKKIWAQKLLVMQEVCIKDV